MARASSARAPRVRLRHGRGASVPPPGPEHGGRAARELLRVDASSALARRKDLGSMSFLFSLLAMLLFGLVVGAIARAIFPGAQPMSL